MAVFATVIPSTETSCAMAARESACRDRPGVVRGVTVRNWWRWTLRGLALLAFVAAGIFLGLRPVVSSHVRSFRDVLTGVVIVIPAQTVTFSCLSPFDRIQGSSHPVTLSRPQLPRMQITGPLTALGTNNGGFFNAEPLHFATRVCSAATNGREHLIDALGIGAVILIGLSFLPRRRPVVTVSVNPSLL
jgi:hypothetical protein